MVFTSSDPCRLVVIPWLEFISHFFDYLFSFFSLTIIGISYKVRKSLDFSRLFVVEVRRIELLSENPSKRFSPSAAYGLGFPPPHAHRRACGLGSFIM